MCLSVHCDGRVVVTSPPATRKSSIERFVEREREWLAQALESFRSVDRRNIIRLSPDDYKKNKDRALRVIQGRIEYYNAFYGFSYNKIFVKNQKTCWGSCSEKKNLNFNYKITLLPKSLMDYVIVHELCHLKELNHSDRFWALVEKQMPEYRKQKKQLCEQEKRFR